MLLLKIKPKSLEIKKNQQNKNYQAKLRQKALKKIEHCFLLANYSRACSLLCSVANVILEETGLSPRCHWQKLSKWRNSFWIKVSTHIFLSFFSLNALSLWNFSRKIQNYHRWHNFKRPHSFLFYSALLWPWTNRLMVLYCCHLYNNVSTPGNYEN